MTLWSDTPEEALPALAAELSIPYDTLVRYAREGRILARKSGGVWLSTHRAIEAAGIKPRRQRPGFLGSSLE